MKRLQINLTEEQYEELRKTAFEEKVSISSIIRDVIGSLTDKRIVSLNIPGDETPEEVKEYIDKNGFSNGFNPQPKPGKKKG